MVPIAWTAPLTWTTGHVATAAELNAQLRDNLNFLYGDTSWTPVVYANSWTDFGAPFPTVAYRFVGTRVVLRGTMKSGTINSPSFTLASGYRPALNLEFIVNSNGSAASLLVAGSGAVTVQTGTNTQVSVDGVTFDTI